MNRKTFPVMIHIVEILLSLFISVKFTVNGVQLTSPSNSSDNRYDIHLSRSSREVKSVIYIGVILTDEDKNIGRAFENGVQAANEVLSQSGTLSSYQLEPIIQFVPKDNVFKATQQACKILDRGIIALYGPSSTSLAQALLSLANRFGLPYVETHWSMVQRKTTYAIHLHPSIESYGIGLYEYLTQVEKWKRMTLIYNKPESLLKFTTLVNNFEGILKIKSWDENASGARAMMAELGSGLEKNFLVDIPSWQVANFLVMAYVHNMTGYQYTFIFTDWYLFDFCNNLTNTQSHIWLHMNGVLFIVCYVNSLIIVNIYYSLLLRTCIYSRLYRLEDEFTSKRTLG